MKKSFVLFLVGLMSIHIMAQDSKDTIIKIDEHSIFSLCFKDIDTNCDGIVDCCEAKKATFLSLERGGRSNVIDNYDFLQYFPNLTAFGIGTTPVEEIDLRKQTKIEKLHVGNASWLKKIILAEGCKPEISGKDDVQVVFAPQPMCDIKITCPQCGTTFHGKSAKLFMENPRNHKSDCPLFNKVIEVPQVSDLSK